MDLFKYEKEYYDIKELVENINHVLHLSGKDSIQPFNISEWKKKGFILTKSKYRYSKEEYLNILGFVYLKISLGIINNKIRSTQATLITVAERPKTAVFQNHLTLIKLYNG